MQLKRVRCVKDKALLRSEVKQEVERCRLADIGQGGWQAANLSCRNTMDDNPTYEGEKPNQLCFSSPLFS